MKSLLSWSRVILWLLVILSSGAISHREHKVHNIVLYPDKHSWCKTLPIKQVISYPGCKSEEIDNNVCVGACFSYSIPHTEPSDPSEVIVPYCDSCQPSETTWQHITLGCSDKSGTETLPQLVKRVEIIVNCSCSSCETMNGNRNLSDDDELLLHYNDVPDLMNMLHMRNESNTTISIEHTENMKNMMNHKMIALLQSIQEKNSQYDKIQLMELLQLVQGPDQKLSEKTIANFVDSLHSEHIELDIPKLKEILIKFEHSKLYEKHQKLTTVNSNAIGGPSAPSDKQSNQLDSGDNMKDEDDIEQSSHHHHHHHHLHHLHHHLSSGGGGSSSTSSGSSSGGSTGGAAGGGSIADSSSNQSPLHHQAGENFGHGHLVKGPRGALVIEPVDLSIHEKLVVNPYELKLNHAGTLLTYGSDLIEKRKEIDE